MGIENKVLIEDEAIAQKYIVVQEKNQGLAFVAKACPAVSNRVKHKDIFGEYLSSVKGSHETHECICGGRLWIGDGKIVVFDTSSAYGHAEETTIQTLLEPYCHQRNIELVLKIGYLHFECPEIDLTNTGA